MPTYQYSCKQCEKKTEERESITAPPKEKCEACGGKVERLIATTHFVLKGSGWFKDGY